MEISEDQILELKNKIQELERKLEEDKGSYPRKKIEQKMPIHEIYHWEAPDRIELAHSKGWYTAVATISIITIFFALINSNFMLVLAVIAIVLLIYVINSVPAKQVRNSITNKGIKIAEDHYLWSDIDYFWVSERGGKLVINIEQREYRGRLYALVGDGDINRIVTEMIKYEDYREPKGLINFLVDGKSKKITDFMIQN